MGVVVALDVIVLFSLEFEKIVSSSDSILELTSDIDTRISEKRFITRSMDVHVARFRPFSGRRGEGG